MILVDENGQPYLAHGVNLRQTMKNVGGSLRSAGTAVANTARSAGAGLGRGVRQNHKYIMKIGEGAQARYLYTQEEVRAYQQAAQRQAQAAANRMKTAGQNALNVAKNTADKAVNTAKDTASDLKTKADHMREEFREKKEERKPVITYKETDSEGNVTKELHGAKALGATAKVAGQVTGQIVKAKTEQEVAKAKMAAENAVDKASDAIDSVKDKVTDVAYDIADDVKGLKSAADAKSKSNKYKKEAERLNKELVEARRANNWEDTPETKKLEEQYIQAMKDWQAFDREAKKKFGMTINKQYIFGKRMY